MYGTTITKGKYAHQHIMALADMSVADAATADEAPHGFQIHHQKKSFIVFAPSATDKTNWMNTLRKYIKVQQDAWPPPPPPPPWP